jgi:hypothetical protein
VATRVTSILSFLAILQYVHRAPMVAAQAEPVLSMLLFYLSIGPCGARLSVDALLNNMKPPARRWSTGPHWTATVSLRLIQVHLAMFYLMMGMAKLHGDVWWRGEGVWALMAMPRSRWTDYWIRIRDWGLLLNLWSHAIVFYELSFAVLIWNRWLRPLVIALGVVLWLAIIPVAGMIVFPLAMIVAMAAFIPGDFWRRS